MSRVEGTTVLGFTGHQGLSPETEFLVRRGIDDLIPAGGNVKGFCSFAEGSDQIFAEVILEHAGELVGVIPSSNYESTFSASALVTYKGLVAAAKSLIEMGYPEPSEEAFWHAGRRVVEEADEVIAVWNGKPAGGLGGTADVVAYARELGKVVHIVWPEGSTRE